MRIPIAVTTFLIAVMVNVETVCSQRRFHFQIGLEYSGLGSYQFQQKGFILKRGWHDPYTSVTGLPAFSFAVNYKVAPQFILEGGIQLTEMDMIVHEVPYVDSHPAVEKKYTRIQSHAFVKEGNFAIWQNYTTGYVSAAFLFNTNNEYYKPYLGGGLAFNSLGSRNANLSASYVSPGGEILALTTRFHQNFSSLFFELGIRGSISPRRPHNHYFSAGAKYYLAGNMMSGDYVTSLNGTVMRTDHVVATNNYFAIAFRYGLNPFKENKSINKGGSHRKSVKKTTRSKPGKSKQSEREDTDNTRDH